MDGNVPARAWIAFFALCLGMFMAILDIQIVATSLPDIQASLKISANRLSWIQTAYLIAEVIAIPLTGFLARALSTRWLFTGATLGFTIASAFCASATGFADLVFWRSVQGFCGGVLIPLVFAAVFLMFPLRLQGRATVIAGVVAMLAPTVGPLIGGYITETFGWPWLFLINIAPGIVVAVVIATLLRIDRPNWHTIRQIDFTALILLAAALASLEILLKEAPALGWSSAPALGLLALTAVAGTLFIARCRRHRDPLVDLSPFARRSFSIGCWYSFVLGMALYSAVYLMPLFLAYVRQRGPIEIGLIIIVTGAAQLVAAPIAVWAEQRFDPLRVTLAGYALLGIGLIASGFQTYQTDFNEMFWPQVARGFAIPFCLLPATRLALGGLPDAALANASGLFNLMRNLGGAIGIAVVDTIVEHRAPGHVATLVERLQMGDRATALLVGLPPDRFTGRAIGPIDQATIDAVRPLVERGAAVMSFNDAWLLLGILTVVSLFALPALSGRGAKSVSGDPHA